MDIDYHIWTLITIYGALPPTRPNALTLPLCGLPQGLASLQGAAAAGGTMMLGSTTTMSMRRTSGGLAGGGKIPKQVFALARTPSPVARKQHYGRAGAPLHDREEELQRWLEAAAQGDYDPQQHTHTGLALPLLLLASCNPATLVLKGDFGSVAADAARVMQWGAKAQQPLEERIKAASVSAGLRLAHADQDVPGAVAQAVWVSGCLGAELAWQVRAPLSVAFSCSVGVGVGVGVCAPCELASKPCEPVLKSRQIAVTVGRRPLLLCTSTHSRHDDVADDVA